MGERLSRFGAGPKIASATVVAAAVAGIASYEYPLVCLVPELRYQAVAAFAWLLIAIGVVMWLAGAVTVMRAYNRDELVTSGVYTAVRHPMYAGWIMLILPGLTLLTTAWPLLLAPLVAYAVFKQSIHREDEYLAKRFGRGYVDYRARVNEIIPIPRLRRN
jgi:protein-S-isoprenylcysteine O-methyltransferase Ste14